MTEEEFYRLGELTRAAIVEEIDSRIGRVIAVAEHVDELDRRTLTLADRLTKITAALVEADGALSQRIESLERFAASFAPGNEYEDTLRTLTEGSLMRMHEKLAAPTRPKKEPGFWRNLFFGESHDRV